MPPLLIICPMFPPMKGGLPHHTDLLASALARRNAVTLLTSPGVDTDRPFPIRPEVTRWAHADSLLQAILQAAPAGPLLWQYVPHMYGRGGVNLALPRVWARLRALGRRQVVIAHEIRAPLSPWPHRLAYALAHRWMWRALRRHADAVGVSTAGWLEDPGLIGPHPDRFFLAPSPSNLPVAPVPPDHAAAWRARHSLADARRVLGFFGSPGAGKQFEWVLASWRAARIDEPATALVVIGGEPRIPLSSGEAPWFRPLGYLNSHEASQALQALDVLGLPFVDGVSERRSSFMTGLAHGLPIVSTLGPATGATLRRSAAFAHAPADLNDYGRAVAELLGNPARRQRLARLARDEYAARYDWPQLAVELQQRLDPKAASA